MALSSFEKWNSLYNEPLTFNKITKATNLNTAGTIIHKTC